MARDFDALACLLLPSRRLALRSHGERRSGGGACATAPARSSSEAASRAAASPTTWRAPAGATSSCSTRGRSRAARPATPPGLVTQFNPSPTMMRFRRYSIELYRELGVFETVGSVRIASSPESLAELQRGVSRARAIGLDVELASPAETLRAAAAGEPGVALRLGLPAGRRPPRSALRDLRARERGARAGRRDPHGRARDRHRARRAPRGARRRSPSPAASRPRSSSTPPACGRRRSPPWPAPRSSRSPSSTSTSRWRRSTGTSCRATCRASATPTTSSTASPRRAACSSAATSTIRSRAGSTACRGITAARRVPADEARFAPLMQGAAQRFPFLADAGVVKLVCHPDAMTPDGNPLVGELPGVPGFYVAAGLSLNGFGGAGGIGKAVAELVTTGESELDLQSYRPWRFGARAPRPALRRRDRARGLPLLLPPALPARQRRARASPAHERAARAHAGRGRRLRGQERLGARRLLRARAGLAAGGGGAARLRLGRAALRAPARRGVRGAARARRA